MPRLSRKFLSGKFFHVMVQGINKEFIFNTNENKDKYKKIILKNYEKVDESELNILSYCLMSNHTHFLFFCENFPLLSTFMHKVNSAYSKYYNKSYSRVGYVFRDRFKVQEIIDMDHLYNCIRYIHNNPVKAGICSSMGDYKYSSYNEFFGLKEIINDKSIELLFGNNSNYISCFENIHVNFNSKDFLEIRDTDIKDFTNAYLSRNCISFNDIKNNKVELKIFIKEAKKETNITLTDLATFLGLSRNIVGYQYRKP